MQTTTDIIDVIEIKNFLMERLQEMAKTNNDQTYLEDADALTKVIIDTALEHIKYDYMNLYCFFEEDKLFLVYDADAYADRNELLLGFRCQIEDYCSALFDEEITL